MQNSAQTQDRQMLMNVINKTLSNTIASTGKIDLNVRSVNDFIDLDKNQDRVIVNFSACTEYQYSQIIAELRKAGKDITDEQLREVANINLSYSFPRSFVKDDFFVPSKGEKVSVIIGTYTNSEGVECLGVEKVMPIGKATTKKVSFSVADLLNGPATVETETPTEADSIADAVANLV